MEFLITTPEGVDIVKNNGTSFYQLLDGGFNDELVDIFGSYFLKEIHNMFTSKLYRLNDNIYSVSLPKWVKDRISDYIGPKVSADNFNYYVKIVDDNLSSMVKVYVEGDKAIVVLDRAILVGLRYVPAFQRMRVLEQINVALSRKLTPTQFYAFPLVLRFLDLTQTKNI